MEFWELPLVGVCFFFFLNTEVITNQCNGELKITRNSNTNSLKWHFSS